MLKTFARRWLVCLSLLALALGTGGAAWGCVPQPLVSLQPRSSGPRGSEVTVEALAFGSAPVEVRWNGVDGELLATASGPQFSVPVTIPQVPEGLSHIVVFERDQTGAVGSSGRAAFLVTSPPGTDASSPPSTATTSSPPPSSDSTSPALLGAGLGMAVVGGLVGAAVVGRSRPAKSGHVGRKM
jgi:hypothetical protein